MLSHPPIGRSRVLWVYAAYLVAALLLWGYITATQEAPITGAGCFAVALDATALIAFYGFIRQGAIASSWVWQLFFLIYVGKLVSSLGMLICMTAHFHWRGFVGDNAELWGLVGALLTFPMLYALYVYAFRSVSVWHLQGAPHVDQHAT
jgi:hypothetical protein